MHIKQAKPACCCIIHVAQQTGLNGFESMSACCTVRVRGFPTDLPPERVADKLTIHFLRARNGGGEIVNIEFTPESPDCVLVTFEDAAVTQQVLKAEKHILSVSGKDYPLEVSACPSELNPNEVFVHVLMKIDYGCCPDGKDILWNLRKQYGDVQFHFNSQATTCSVKGSFTALQAFSSEFMRCLRSKQSRSNATESSGRSANKAAGSGALHQEVLERQEEKKNEKGVGGDALPLVHLAESHIGPLEDFSLVIDSDIYLYMQKFCRKEFSDILHRHQVGVVDVNSDGVTTLYLQAASDEAGGVSTLVSAHLAISQLSQQLEITLRKEKISKRDLGLGGGRGLPQKLQSLCPLLLCHEDDGHFYFIGNLVEVSRAKQYVQDFTAARAVVQDHQKHDDLQAAHTTLIQARSPVLAPPESSAESVPRKLGSSRSNSKAECKLAANFDSGTSLSYLASQDTPQIGQLPQGSFQTVDYQTPDSQQVVAAATKSENQIRQAPEFEKVPHGMKADTPLPVTGGSAPNSEARMNFHLMKSSPPNVASSTLRSLNLFDSTGSVDLRVPQPRPLLRRSSSSLWLRSQNSSESTAEPLQSARGSVDQEEEIYHALQKNIRKEDITLMDRDCKAESQITTRELSSSISLTVQKDDEAWTSAMQKADILAVHPNYIHERFSYSELAMEGPDDEALANLCHFLKEVCHDYIIISRDRYKLDLAYSREMKLQVLEAFRFFSAQRVDALSKQVLSCYSQPGKIQDEPSSSEIQRSPQQLQDSSRTSLLDSPLHLGSFTEDKPSTHVQRFLDASGFQPLMTQNFPSDRKAWESKNLDKAPDTSKQDRPGRPIAEVKRGLPDKFHLGRDWGKERCSREAEGVSSSLPVLPLDVSASVPLQGVGKRSPPAGEGDASDLYLRAANPRRESAVGECELCRSTHATMYHAPCGHTLCKVCFSTSGISPACCSASCVAIPGSFTATTMSQSLPGYFRDPTLKITYNIPDGVQQAQDPHPGHPYRGGHFEAFLPDNPEGQRLMVLLHKAFERGLTFQIRTCGSEERVVWGPIPHKTSMEGGKPRNGYPDAHYLQHISRKLQELRIE